MLNRTRKCPRCGEKYTRPPALSRLKGGGVICPDCGLDEGIGRGIIPVAEWPIEPRTPDQILASAWGRKGGSVSSPAKTKAVRENARRPRKRARG